MNSILMILYVFGFIILYTCKDTFNVPSFDEFTCNDLEFLGNFYDQVNCGTLKSIWNLFGW